MTTAIVFLLAVIYSAMKGLCDGRLWAPGDLIADLCYRNGLRCWYDGRKPDGSAYAQGYFWREDYWHLMDDIRNMCPPAMTCLVIADASSFLSWQWYHIVFFWWLMYWFPAFSFVYHYLLRARDYTLKQWLVYQLKFWE